MPNDLFFSQPVSPSPPAGIQSGCGGASGLSQSSNIQTSSTSPEGDKDKFLTTLKTVTRNGTSEKTHPAEGQASLTESAASVEVGEMNEEIDLSVTPVEASDLNETELEPVPIPFDWNSAGFIKILEGLGLSDAIEVSDLRQMTEENPADMNQLAALEMLVDRLLQNQSELPHDLQAELPWLQQFIVNFRNGQIPLAVGDSLGQGLNPYQVTAPDPESGKRPSLRSVFGSSLVVELQQIIQGTRSSASGLQEPKIASDLLNGPAAADAKVAVTMPVEGGKALWPTENAIGASQLGKPTDSEAANLPNGLRSPLAGINQESLVNIETEAESTDKVKDKGHTGPWPGRQVNTQNDIGHRLAPVRDQSDTPANARDSHSQSQEPPSERATALAKFSNSPAQGLFSEEPISRVFQEIQLAKEGVAKVEPVSLEDNLSKVVKLEAPTNDSSLLNSSGQNPDKFADTVGVKKEAETGHGDLRTQTMDQIVRKAAIHLRNGQHEARIELKPDFLGHVRMQVISENQQVTVKILAEHGFVKEMIEGNMHQLKAELQQQGLEIDKLEVTVARDPEDSANNKDKLAQFKFRQGSENQRKEDEPGEEQAERPRRSILNNDKSSAVDFFA